MNLWKKLKKWICKSNGNEDGYFVPVNRESAPLRPEIEMKLRDVMYDCPNVKMLVDELDRMNILIKDQDHELWLQINKGK